MIADSASEINDNPAETQQTSWFRTAGFSTTFKNHLRAKKEEWTSVRLDKIPTDCLGLEPHDLLRGAVGIYLRPVFQDTDADGKVGKKKYPWPCIDIEAKGAAHDDLGANIAAARDAYVAFESRGLIDGLEVMLTGRGFRFIWPFLLPDGYLGPLVKLLEKEIPAADTGTFKQPIRLIAYRGFGGKNRQDKGKPPLNRHTHLLDDPRLIFDMKPRDYTRLADGRLPDGAPDWLTRLLPKDFAPRPWLDTLEPYRKADIRGGMIDLAKIDIPRTRAAGVAGHAVSQALRYLDTRGTEHQELTAGEGTIFKPSECPMCGRKGTNAWVTPSGWLKCHSTSCQAGQPGDDGKIAGMAPSDWIPDYEEPEGDTPGPETDERPAVSKEAAREIIRRAIVDGKDDLLVTMQPGVGKTVTTILAVGELVRDGKRVVIAAPTHKKARETLQAVKEHLTDVLPTPVGKRSKANCKRHKEADAAARLGYAVGPVFCPTCDDSDDCPYRKQFDWRQPSPCPEPPVEGKVMRQDTLPGMDTPRPDDPAPAPPAAPAGELKVMVYESVQMVEGADLIVVDEDCTRALIREKKFGPDDFLAFIDTAAWAAKELGEELDYPAIHQAATKILKGADDIRESRRGGHRHDTYRFFPQQPPKDLIPQKHGEAPRPVLIREACDLDDKDMAALGSLAASLLPWERTPDRVIERQEFLVQGIRHAIENFDDTKTDTELFNDYNVGAREPGESLSDLQARLDLEIEELARMESGTPETYAQWQRRLLKGYWIPLKLGRSGDRLYEEGALNMHMLRWMLCFVGLEDDGFTGTLEIKPNAEKDPVTFHLAWRRPLPEGARLILLDGTGNREDYERLTGRSLREVNAHCSITGNGNRFHHVKRALGKGILEKMGDAKREKVIRKELGEARGLLYDGDRRVVVATHEFIEEDVRRIAREVLAPRRVEVIHFHGNRGLNAYEFFDAIILFGTTTKNLVEAYKHARVLGYSEIADIEACMKRQTDAENVQTVHRVRPINGNKTVVVIGGKWPEGLPKPDTTQSRGRGTQMDRNGERGVTNMAAAIERADRFYSEFGFISKGACLTLGIGGATDKEREAAERSLDFWKRWWIANERYPYFSNSKTCFVIQICNLYSKTCFKNSKVGTSPEKGSAPEWGEAIILGDARHWYENILKALRARHPDAGEIESAQGTINKVFTDGLGIVEAAREFYRMVGAEDQFKPDLWRQTAPPWVTVQPLTPQADALQPRGPIAIRPEQLPPGYFDRYPDDDDEPARPPSGPTASPVACRHEGAYGPLQATISSEAYP